MKIVGDEVSYGFASITRSGIAEGKYPGQWKTGKVKTIFKKGKKDLCDNYRPLTMLSIPSKITKRVICETLEKTLKRLFKRINGVLGKDFLQNLYSFTSQKHGNITSKRVK